MATNQSKKTNSQSTSKKSSTSSKKSSTPSYQKKAIKTAKKVAKKNPKAFIIIVLVLLLAVGAGFAVWYFFIKDKQSKNNEPATGMTINFLELGNKYTGDSTYIKAGDIDILIDAGSRNSSSTTIKNYIDQYCTDGKLEYVIATHAHQDHIAGFVGTSANPGIFETHNIGTLIDFAFAKTNSQVYNNYMSLRTSGLESGKIEHHYTALECVEESNGAKNEYTLAEGITMKILDQKYYHEPSSDENNHSVCTLFTQGSNNYLFTGDLEKEGEASLVELNRLPHCQLFKGGHHGSPTSNNDSLLDAITPENVCICCCAGHDEYTDDPRTQFPSRAALERISKHTDNIYVTTVSPDGHDSFESMNGIITFKCEEGSSYTITGSNNSLKLKETEWYSERQKLWKEWDDKDAAS